MEGLKNHFRCKNIQRCNKYYSASRMVNEGFINEMKISLFEKVISVATFF